MTFSISATPPAVTTGEATSIGSVGATVNASVNPEGTATTFSFVFGTDSTLTSGTTTTTVQSAGSGTNAESENATLSGRDTDTLYYFEVQATNSGGTTFGAILYFTTLATALSSPATTEQATSISATGVTLQRECQSRGKRYYI